uniref:Uncharacterized protein n=1 Tax=Marseillevirus LCMAC101 TaxID=2506602 RepID=A0A481YQN2_9VIRU|nr:MAG: hypothetical protein LCMAC101_01400 [Marseillevirus LCMAC101]
MVDENMTESLWKVIPGENPLIFTDCPVDTAVELLAHRWCEIKQKDLKELAGLEEEEMRQVAESFRKWVESEYPGDVYDTINTYRIYTVNEDNFYEAILVVGIENHLEDGRPIPIKELACYMQDECYQVIDLDKLLETEGEDVAASVFKKWMLGNHPLMFDRLLEYQTTQEGNVFKYR